MRDLLSNEVAELDTDYSGAAIAAIVTIAGDGTMDVRLPDCRREFVVIGRNTSQGAAIESPRSISHRADEIAQRIHILLAS